ncbi:MAG: TIGR04283 family arsenosugar biosynthesis glycosyltransferase [Elusimicrobiota bacterium]
MRFSIIVPVWNEARHIAPSLERLRAASPPERVEIVVVDGGSRDGTAQAARPRADRLVSLGAPNRGAQLHAGAEASSGDLLFFLHSDTRPPSDWCEILERFWSPERSSSAAATVFSVDYGPGWSYRLVAWGQNTRVRVRRIAYGDAGFCVPRELYVRSGGFPPAPLMEDVLFSRRLRGLGRIVLLPERIAPSARRLRANGPVVNSLRNSWIRARFALGATPERLWRDYYGAGPEGSRVAEGARGGRSLLVFLKAPVPGKVKTRLSREIGAARAAEAYAAMARAVREEVECLSGMDIVWSYAPEPGFEDLAWLGLPGAPFRRQPEGDLGRRLEAAFERAFAESGGPVCAIGTDSPGLPAATITAAFDALESHDLVVGPAEDGGYYLIGMSRHLPGLFCDIPWSGPLVFEKTLERAREEALRVKLLPAYFDVDTARDLERWRERSNDPEPRGTYPKRDGRRGI